MLGVSKEITIRLNRGYKTTGLLHSREIIRKFLLSSQFKKNKKKKVKNKIDKLEINRKPKFPRVPKTIGNYEFLSFLGKGAYGKVKLAINKKTSEYFGIKIFKKDDAFEEDKMRPKIQKEISIMKMMFHPHVILIYEVLEDGNFIYLVIEYCRGGTLLNYLIANRGYVEYDQMLKFFQEIISGLDYIHDHKICHRDIKLENILLLTNLCIKIADFGLATVCEPKKKLKEFCGSPLYCSPELIKGKGYDGMITDIWSTGVVLYMLLTGNAPFSEKLEKKYVSRFDEKYGKEFGVHLGKLRFLFFNISKIKPFFPEYLTRNCENLINSMFITDPLKRIKIKAIKMHPWYKSASLPGTVGYDPPEFKMKSLNMQIERAEPELVDLMMNLEISPNRETLIKGIKSKNPTQNRFFYKYLEWRRARMEYARFKVKMEMMRKNRRKLEMKRNKKRIFIHWSNDPNKIRGFFEKYAFGIIGIFFSCRDIDLEIAEGLLSRYLKIIKHGYFMFNLSLKLDKSSFAQPHIKRLERHIRLVIWVYNLRDRVRFRKAGSTLKRKARVASFVRYSQKKVLDHANFTKLLRFKKQKDNEIRNKKKQAHQKMNFSILEIIRALDDKIAIYKKLLKKLLTSKKKTVKY